MRWLFFSVIGLSLIGLGVSLVGEAIIFKMGGKPWFLFGTLALIVLNSGVCLVAEAVILKIALNKKD